MGGRIYRSASLLSPLWGFIRIAFLTQGCGPLLAALALGFILAPLRGALKPPLRLGILFETGDAERHSSISYVSHDRFEADLT